MYVYFYKASLCFLKYKKQKSIILKETRSNAASSIILSYQN